MTDLGRPEFRELVERTRGLQPWRRLFHALSGVTLAALPFAPGVGRTGTLWLLAGAAAVLFTVDAVRLRVPAVNAFVFAVLPSLISPREETGMASSTWYVVGAFLTYLAFPLEIAVPAILVLALADPAAAVIGRTWGKRRVGKGSVEGTAVFVTVAFAIMTVALLPPEGAGSAAVGGALLRAAVAAVLAAAVEIAPLPLDDNLSVPLGAAAAIWLVTVA